MSKSFSGFRVFLDGLETASAKDKADDRNRASSKTKTMGVFDGEKYFAVRGSKNRKDDIYRKAKESTPEIVVGADVNGIDANYVPVTISPGKHGGSMKVIPVGASMQASKDGRDLDQDEIMSRLKDRRMKRRAMQDFFGNRPWGPALAAAGGGAAGPAPGASPPM